MSRVRLVILGLACLSGLAFAQTTRRSEPASAADSASVDAIVSALYASVSHPAGGSPDFDRMRRIFHYVGMLVPPKAPGAPDFRVMDVDQFSERFEKSVAERKQKGEAPTGFFEREIGRRTDSFGNVCHVFSAYEARRAAADEKPFVRGINSIQLLNDGRRWWIMSVVWDTERPDNPIPAQYLSAAKP